MDNAGVFTRGNDVDKFFLCEEDQKISYKGIKPWQFGPVNREVFFSERGVLPGGHIRALNGAVDYHNMIFETERIKVDESTWLPLFRKNRWFDFNSVEPLLGGRSWSVDIPQVWDTIRTSIELANRMLLALINDQHIFLQTLMYGKLGWWNEAAALTPNPMPEPHPKAAVLLSYPYFKQLWEGKYPNIPCNQDMLTTLTPADWRTRFESLTANQEWSFISGKEAEGIEGITFEGYGNVICLSTSAIVSLLSGKLTLSERCNGEFRLARTILHELGHAIINIRISEQDPDYNLLRGENLAEEPYVDFAGAAELGFALEQVVFGGVMFSCTYKGPHSITLGHHLQNWPFPFLAQVVADNGGAGFAGTQAIGHPAFAPGVPCDLVLVPAMFTSNLLSAAFWDDPAIPRKSDHFFYRSSLFRSRTPNNPGSFIDFNRNPIVLDQGLLDERLMRGPLHEVEQEMIRDWNLRENLWNEMRSGWYPREKEIWLATPWSHIYGRKQLLLFEREYKKNALRRDNVETAKLAQSLTAQATWNQSRDNYIASLSVRRWVWHVVGLLMSAAIPIRTNAVSRKNKGRQRHFQLFPSMEAAGRTSKYIPLDTKPPRPVDVVAESVLFDPFRREGVATPAGSIEHTDYLDLVMKLIGHFATTRAALQAPWLNEILRVEGVIRQDRMAQRGLPRHQRISTWATWDFVLPEYDPITYFRWDPIQNIWAKV